MIRVDQLPPNALRVIAVFFGLMWGSFLNVVIHRVPRGESVVKPGSKCPACGKPIKPWDNIPVLSWLILRVEALGGIASIAVLELMVLPHGQASAVRAFAIYLTDFAVLLALIATAFIDF